MEILNDPEEMIMCPYNSSHHIRRKCMNTHLVKCKKANPDSKLVECDFNVNHKVLESELQYHHDHCPDKKKIEVTIFAEHGSESNRYPVRNVQIHTEESWDDGDVPTYDPKKNCEAKAVLRHLDVESAAKRKEFRRAERRRLGQFNDVETRESSGPSNSSIYNSTGLSARRNLPETARNVLTENTPSSIGEIMKRIHQSAGQSFLPKPKK